MDAVTTTYRSGKIMYIQASSPEVRRILESAKNVTGKRNGDVAIGIFTGPKRMNSYWDDGSKDEFCLVDLSNYRSWSVPSAHPFYDRLENGDRAGNLELRELPYNTCLVEGGYFRGKPRSFRILFRDENIAKLLPAPTAPMSDGAKSALNIIATHQGGYRQDAFSRAGLGTYNAQNPLVVELEASGMIKINKAGAISVTTSGRNYR
jgi:hypothetical protein